jgi:cation-transporting ATPase 13A1
MIFSTERVSANTFEAFLFIGFLLIFAIAASAYVWIKGEPFVGHASIR